MKKIAIAMLFSLMFSFQAVAETFTYVVPAGPDGGNGKWAQNFVKQWDKKLQAYGHNMVIRYLPGQQGRKANSEWQKNMSSDPTVVVQSSGGFIGWLTKPDGWAGFDPIKNVDTIGLQLQGTFVFLKSGVNPETDNPAVHIDGGSEVLVDIMGHALMVCGNQSVDETIACMKSTMRLVKGFKGSGERRQAYLVNQLQISRDGFAHKRKTYKDELKAGKTVVWYSHGTVNNNGDMIADPNEPESWFNDAFVARWGEQPSGEFYDAYNLIIKARSSMGKSVYTMKNNPNKEILIKAWNDVLADKEAMKILTKKLGKYDWKLGDEAQTITQKVWATLNTDTYLNVIKIRQAFGEKAKIRPELAE